MGKKRKRVAAGNCLLVLRTKKMKLFLLFCVALVFLVGCPKMPTQTQIVTDRDRIARETVRVMKESVAGIEFTQPLTLEDCIRIGLQNNLELRVKDLERAIASKDTLAEKLRMLPGLNLDGGIEYRDKLRKSDVYNWQLDKDQKDYTVSELKDSAKANLSLTWNVLDTILAYVRSGEKKMYEHILKQQHHRQAQFLALDITEAYWQAAAVEDALDYVHTVVKKLKKVKQDIDEAVKMKALDVMAATEAAMRLKELELTIRKLQTKLSKSRLNLSQYMGFNQNIEYTLYRPPIKPVVAALPHTRDLDIDRLEEYALTHRPDLFERDMQVRIQKEEAKRTFWQLFPGVNFFAATHYDANRLLLSNTWNSVGAGLGWNLLDLPSRLMEHKKAGQSIDMAEVQRLMLTVGVITQVHIALLDYAIKVDRFRLMEDTYILSADLLDMAKQKVTVGKLKRLDATQRHLEEMAAKLRRDEAVVDMIVAHKRLCVAIGIDPLDCDNSLVAGARGEGVAVDTTPLKRWKCSECGYIHTGPRPPEFCPLCGATRGRFTEYDGEGDLVASDVAADWRDKGEPVIREEGLGRSTSDGYSSGSYPSTSDGYSSGSYPSSSTYSSSSGVSSAVGSFLWKLQVGSFRKGEGAAKRITQLVNADLRIMDPRDATIEPANVPNLGAVHRVRFINLTQSDATNMKNELKQKGMEYWIIPPNSMHW